jgi:type II secretory pathway pseudopilin PulG
MNKGYTLIELLVVMVVMITVGVIIASILVSALRGSSKTTVVEEVRNNGNFTILQMGKMIGFAQAFLGVSTDGVNYITNCTSVPSPRYTHIKIKSFDDRETVFSCNNLANPPTIASNSASFINTNKVSLDPNSCYFTCSQINISEPPVIGINFTLSQRGNPGFFEQRATIPFQTSVTMRNLNE